MALNLKTLTTRALTAAVFVGVLLACINYNYISFTLLFFGVSIWGLIEFYQIAEKLGAKPFKAIGIFSAMLIYAIAALKNPDYGLPSFSFLVPVLFAVLFIAALFSKQDQPVLNLAYTIFGVVYAVIPFTLLNQIAVMRLPECGDADVVCETGKLCYNPHLILGIILLIWASDTFAYLVGSLMGKHKLYEKISPGKTWEGSIGGGLLTLASTLLISKWYPELDQMQWLAVAAIIVVFGTCGDLIESLLKRQAGIKDSGTIMPGHGGILDRFDSLLFVSPFLYAYLSYIFS